MLTCAALVVALLNAQPGQTLTLSPGQQCGPVSLRYKNWVGKPVTVNAEGSTIRGLTIIGGGGFRMVGGTLEASDGMNGAGTAGYSARLRSGVKDVQFSKVRFTNARMGIVIGAGSEDIVIRDSLFDGLRADGVHLFASKAVTIENNEFRDFKAILTKCVLADSSFWGGSRKKCEGLGGKWYDGDHSDAVQFRGEGLRDINISGNRITGDMQAIVQFGSTKGDPPQRVRIVDNYIRTASYWGVSAQNMLDLTLTGNDVGRMDGSDRKVKMLATNSIGKICGNKSQDTPRNDPAVRPCA